MRNRLCPPCLTSGILASGKLPRKAATGAAHIAIAALHGTDFLVTSNRMHVADAAIIKAPASICRRHGCECPVICTPEEVLGEQAMSRDPIVDEVRRARESEAAKHRFDVKAILSAAKKRQRRSRRIADDRFVQSVKRNIERFPEDFMFQITTKEALNKNRRSPGFAGVAVEV